ncbi:hypothetical protein CJD36_010235 [Flavipsychrobacter stenotrophus]|uniref:Chromosomal replication initiator DnaA C-terminal domain-containing protein n=1 Tax=Flavipsychrobacter stenotrophus TaxID=2077091 RepID=A0A2S7SUY6_9BACT|nr:hypothetical protein [Flavipsychrobacter stenotrophus]PQJ10346.1 hypothetical protein CJD36_010235 [Flavipsychrobacter stenotrophus]
MKKSVKIDSSSTRGIARSAQRKIQRNTGATMNLVLCSGYEYSKSPESMLQVIAGTLGMDATCYKQRSRSRPFVELRFIASHFLRTYFPTLTLLNISHYFGALDHATIINGLTRTNELLATGDERFLTKYETVLNSVNQWLQKEMLGYGSAISA